MDTDSEVLSPTVRRMAWTKVVVLTFFLTVALEVSRLLLQAIVGDHPAYAPRTFHTFWEVAVLVGVVWLVRELGVNPRVFGLAFLVGGFVSGVAWFLLPQSWVLLEPNYYAVQSRVTLDTHETTAGGADYDWPLNKGTLYPADSPQILAELRRAGVINEYAATVGFLTWQYGLAFGYIPDRSVAEFDRASNLQLYLTVGPVVVAEAVILGLYRHFVLLLILQLAWFKYTGQQFWEM